MNKLLLALLLILTCVDVEAASKPTSRPKNQSVSGYRTKTGTYVAPHKRAPKK